MKLESDQSIIRASAREFAEKYIRPHIMDWDEKQYFPIEYLKKAGTYGFMGVLVPEAFGGIGLGYNAYTDIIIEISKIDPSIGLSIAAHNSLATNHIQVFGNDEQKQKWLPKLASGEALGSWALTEPTSGSDAANMKTTATKKGDQWVINGTKNFITHGISSEVAVIICRTDTPNTKNNATAFVVERGTKGFSGGKKENKLGMRASETSQQYFENCIIPDSNRLGEVGSGFKQAMKILNGGRISIAALSIGIAKGAFEYAKQYSKKREQFGQALYKFQAIAFKLSQMATQIRASELLMKQAIVDLAFAEKTILSSSMAKVYAAEACVKITGQAVQILGGYGYIKDYPVEKFFRDAKLCTVGEGTSEIQNLVICKELMKY